MGFRGLMSRLDALDDKAFKRDDRTRKWWNWSPQTRSGRIALGLAGGLFVASGSFLGLLGFAIGLPVFFLIASLIRVREEHPGRPSAAAESVAAAELSAAPPEGMLASAVPATKAEIVVRRRFRWTLLAIGIAMFTGFVVIASVSQDHAVRLDKSGGRAGGIVQSVGAPGRFDGDGRIHIAYVVGQRHYLGSVQLDDSSPSFHVGQRVTVEYDRRHPSVMTLSGQDNEPTWSVALASFLVVGAVAVFCWVAVLARRSRQRKRVLDELPWKLTSLDERYQGRLIVEGASYFLPRWFGSSPELQRGPVWLAQGQRGLAVIARPDGTRATLLRNAGKA